MLRLFTSRLYREKVTITEMIKLYCRKVHNDSKELCDECSELLAYALKRIEYCPFSIDKPACNQCPIHCYKKDMREKVKRVMRFSGPKMLIYHPILALMHLLDRNRKMKVTSNLKSPKEVQSN